MKNTLIATSILILFTARTAYAQNSDYPPRIDAWQKNYTIDSMTDENKCAVYYLKSLDNSDQIAILLEPKLITIIQKDLYPRRTVYLRIDKNKHHESSTYDVDAAAFSENTDKIIEEMKNGSNLLLRYSEWPSAASKEVSIPLKDFDGKYNQLFETAK